VFIGTKTQFQPIRSNLDHFIFIAALVFLLHITSCAEATNLLNTANYLVQNKPKITLCTPEYAMYMRVYTAYVHCS